MSANNRSGERRPRRTTQKPQQRKHTPEVVYTPGKAFNRRKLLLHVLTIAAVAFAIFLGLSIFFKVDTVKVSGCGKYSAWTVQEAAGISEGDSLLFFGQASAAGKVIDALPYVKTVRFEIDLPGTVNIIIEEAPVAYSIQDSAGVWWLITAEGRVAEQVDSAVAGQHTQIVGIRLRQPSIGADAVATEQEPAGSSITGADRLDAALLIARMLEKNELLGVASSVNVSSLQALELWYGTRFQVKLGNSENMDYKLAALKSAVAEMSPYQTGVLDASFTTFPNSVGYMPFTE